MLVMGLIHGLILLLGFLIKKTRQV
ncbi:hypothetical protein D3X38_02530 [Acinetobacter baumannii]|nr:hypothetical protein D3X38_02530 [Acinetobacter baumannii]RJN91509.1 hypothetical protein D3X64_04570 [Acinetobacter baumannii]RJO03914.1 hypothetical protein D3X55_20630 [Acinetobacter baumannii]RJO28922.1 hypothetical protein D3X50_10490 [Acinetobacter baumannii]